MIYFRIFRRHRWLISGACVRIHRLMNTLSFIQGSGEQITFRFGLGDLVVASTVPFMRANGIPVTSLPNVLCEQNIEHHFRETKDLA